MCLSQAEHPLQALVFIPKADKGAYADNYRPLDMPDTCDRIIDSAIYAVLAESFKDSLHPVQALLNHFKEPQANYAQMQHYLELKDAQFSVMLSDFAKAFERVNPWVLQCLAARPRRGLKRMSFTLCLGVAPSTKCKVSCSSLFLSIKALLWEEQPLLFFSVLP